MRTNTIPKTIAQIYIDVDVKVGHQARGTNISSVCNEFLKTLLNDDEETGKQELEQTAQSLRARLAEANSKLTAVSQKEKADSSKKQKELLVVAIVKLRNLNVKRQSGSLLATEQYKALFDATMEQFELTRADLADKVF